MYLKLLIYLNLLFLCGVNLGSERGKYDFLVSVHWYRTGNKLWCPVMQSGMFCIVSYVMNYKMQTWGRIVRQGCGT